MGAVSDTPNFFQRIGYICGRTLPARYSGWVVEDLTGPGATRRYLVRMCVPMALVLLLFLLVPGPLWIGASMAALLFLPLVYFTVALTYVFRRNRLVKHGLDPALADIDVRRRAEADRIAYEQRHRRT